MRTRYMAAVALPVILVTRTRVTVCHSLRGPAALDALPGRSDGGVLHPAVGAGVAAFGAYRQPLDVVGPALLVGRAGLRRQVVVDRRSRVPSPSGYRVISTVVESGGTGMSPVSQPQVKTTRLGGSSSRKRPAARFSPLTLVR